MKPSWDHAPEWANYLAMDSDGCWYWYEKPPVFVPATGWWSCSSSGGRYDVALDPPNAAADSLESRPTK
jgi:hypothetical protein